MPTSPVNDLVVQTGGVAQTGLLAGNGASPVAAAVAADVSAALDLISSTQGAILFRGTSAWVALAPGSAGDVLTCNGAGADPSWEPLPP